MTTTLTTTLITALTTTLTTTLTTALTTALITTLITTLTTTLTTTPIPKHTRATPTHTSPPTCALPHPATSARTSLERSCRCRRWTVVIYSTGS